MKVCRARFTLNVVLSLTLLVAVITLQSVLCSRTELLVPNGKYVVSWETETEATKQNRSIIFRVDVETHGYVGFGISPKGGMTGADIVIGGVFPNGTSYFRDAFGVGNSQPVFDVTCNWELIEAWENETHTHLEFSRLLNTCDKQDVAIQNDTSYLIWAIGETDDIKYHGTKRGSQAVNLLDPPLPDADLSKFKTWKMTNTMEMLNQSTTYWCTLHKTPALTAKHHIVGFRPVLPTPEALRHTHHFLVHECTTPSDKEGGDAYFEKHVNAKTSGHCHEGYELSKHCQTYLFVWAVGGKMTLFPEHVGYTIGENGKPSYFMLEVHYNNPDQLSGVKFETGVEFFYTPNIRKHETGMLSIGQGLRFTLTIPPKVSDFVIAGHCSPECTSKIPAEGVNVFNVLLHSHLSGRKLKLRHFRNGTELPWLASDDNYNFDYQQNRPLRQEVRILPGDQLTYECTYDTKWRNDNNVTLAGLSTQEEMCYAFLWTYPRMSLASCQSMADQDLMFKEVGIKEISANLYLPDPPVLQPPSMKNKTYTEVLNTMVEWTPELVAKFQQIERYEKHYTVCSYNNWNDPVKPNHYDASPKPVITYPENVPDYQPPNVCRKNN